MGPITEILLAHYFIRDHVVSLGGWLLLRSLPPLRREEVAQHLVRRYPRWFAGHLIVAKAALRDRRTALAYGAAQLLETCGSALYQNEGILVHARVLLQTGQAAAALSRFQELPASLQGTPSVCEDKAGAHLALGCRDAARTELLRIPESQRSAEALSALELVSSSITTKA